MGSGSTGQFDLARSASTFVDILRRRSLEQPQRIAYVFAGNDPDDDLSITYTELDRKARAIAAMLQAAEAADGRAVLVYPPGLTYVAAFFGCLYAGTAAVPVYPPPRRAARETIQAFIEDAEATAILGTAETLATLRSAQLHAAVSLSWLNTDKVAPGQEHLWREPLIDADTLAYLQYTSGSTSTPRGVEQTHKNLLHNSALIRTAFGHTAESRGVIWLPPYHDMGLIGGILQPLFCGCHITLLSPLAFLQNPIRWLEVISRTKATTSGGPNFAYDLCVRKITPEQRDSLDLSSWEVAFNGAEPIRTDTMDRFAQFFEPCGFRKRAFYCCYGLAEASLIVTGGRPGDDPVVRHFVRTELERGRANRASPQHDDGRKLVGCGQALADQEIAIVNPKSKKRCEPGTIGEIWVRGPSVARGYWNLEDESRRTFGACIEGSGEDSFLRTGDLGFLDESELFVTGRLKELIIFRGRNYYPQDIERAAESSDADLRPSYGAAFSVDCADGRRLVLVYEVERHARFMKQQAIDRIAQNIRRAVAETCALVIHTIVLSKPGSVPKTRSGKVQRHLCRKAFLDRTLRSIGESVLAVAEHESRPAPSTSEAKAANKLMRRALLACDRSSREHIIQDHLAEFLSNSLRRPALSLSRTEPLSGMGVDSLLAVELSHRLETDLQVLIPQTRFLQDISLVELAREIAVCLQEPASDLTSVRRTEITPRASYGQQAMWLQCQLIPSLATYNLNFAFTIKSDVDVTALSDAVRVLVDRHECLRSTFQARRGELIRSTHNGRVLRFETINAADWTQETLMSRIEAEANRPFDLEHGPLVKAVFFLVAPFEHIFLFSVHHLVCDAISLGVLLDELGACYSAAQKNQPPNLQAPRGQYGDYIEWQERLLSGPEGKRLWQYWKTQLDGRLPVLDLPAVRPRPPKLSYQGASHGFTVSKSLTTDLKILARQHGASLYVVLLAAFQVLLHRYSGQDDLIVGTPMNGRSRAQFECIVGHFINTVCLRANLSPDLKFCEFLAQVRNTVLLALEHQHYPFGLLVERLKPDRDHSRSPIFQVMFNMPNVPQMKRLDVSPFIPQETGECNDIGGLKLAAIPLPDRTSMLDLSLTVVESKSSIFASFQYSAELFDKAAIERMGGHLLILLEGIVADPKQTIARLPLLSVAEQREIAHWSRGTVDDSRLTESIIQQINARALRTPDAVAATFKTERESYAGLTAKAKRVARCLLDRRIVPNDIVAVLAKRDIDYLATLLGIFSASGTYLPLDPDHPVGRLQQLITQGKPVFLLTDPIMRPKLDKALAPLSPAQRPQVLQIAEVLHESINDSSFPTGPRLTDTAYVIFTSGSTGEPNGAMIEHRGMLNHIHGKIRDLMLDSRDIVAQTASQCFDISVWQFLAPLLVGGRVHIVPDEIAHHPAKLLDEVSRARVSIWETVPSLLRIALTEAEGRATATELQSLRWLIPTGEKLPPELCRRWLFLYPDVPLLNAYGPTECSDDVTHWIIRRPPEIDSTGVPIGRPIPNVRVQVLDRHLQPVPVRVKGELYVGGVAVGKGYLNDPQRTREAFLPDPLASEPTARLYKTGDLGRYRSDGVIEYLGRCDEQVKIRGCRVELGEIEAAFSKHPAVRDAAAVIWQDERGESRIVAYVITEPLNAPSIAEFREFVGERLPSHMVPNHVVHLKEMPLTANGKLDRQALPGPDSSRDSKTRVPPKSSTEHALTDILRTILQIEVIGITDDFFELGGTSIQMVQVLSNVERQFDVDVPLRVFLQEPTITGLARSIDAARSSGMQSPDAELTMTALKAEAVLDSTVRLPVTNASQAVDDPSRILLTGATGFLGAHLLHALLQESRAEIVCLTRPRSTKGTCRIQEALRTYSLWEERFGTRIVAVEGDLAQSMLGLSPEEFGKLAATVEAIYHCGATVNFVYPYKALKNTNVRGTHEILRLASAEKTKAVNFVSTVSVFGRKHAQHQTPLKESEPIDHVRALLDGYSQSKWVAERLVSIAGTRGVPVRIYRPGRITGHSKTGIWPTGDLLFHVIKTCIDVGLAPELDISVDMTPVDYVGAAIVNISAQKGSRPGEAFHLVNPRPANWLEIIEWINGFGYPIQTVQPRRWLEKLTSHTTLSDRHGVSALLPVLFERSESIDRVADALNELTSLPLIDCQKTQQALAGLPSVCPPVDEALFRLYLTYGREAGHLPRPR